MVGLHLLIALICSLICGVYLQDAYQGPNGYLDYQSVLRSGSPDAGNPQGYRRKPCAKRRSNNEESLITPPPLTPQYKKGEIEEFDCNVGLNNINSAPAQFGVGTPIGMPVQVMDKKVIDVLKDCAESKKSVNNAENSIDPLQITGMRRSMDDPDGNVIADEDEVQRTAAKANNVYNDIPQAEGEMEMVEHSRRNPEEVRVCYACSSATNPSCWIPDKRTTIKYCRMYQQCVTKAFGEGDTFTVIRDCAESCTAKSIPGVEPKYSQCDICNGDLCNSALPNGAFANTCSFAFIIIIAAFKFYL